MITKRIIPTILFKGDSLVKGTRFDNTRIIGHAAQAARIHSFRNVDEIAIFDVSGETSPNLKMIYKMSEGCFTPITAGGCVNTYEDFKNLLMSGADKVCLGSSAIENDFIIRTCADKIGSQAVSVSLDILNGQVTSRRGTVIHEISPIKQAIKMEALGAGEIILGSIDRDGTMTGYDLDMIRLISNSVGIPVVASGGCGSYLDMVDAFEAGADAVAVGALFQFTDATPRAAAISIVEICHNIEIRI